MTHFLLPDLIDIIVTYVSNDILCHDVIRMGWSIIVLSKLEVSYLEHIVDCFSHRINNRHLARNPALTPELIKKVEYDDAFEENILYSRPLIREASLFPNEYVIKWKNPGLPYEQIIKEGKHTIDWKQLGQNVALSYQFLKEHKYQLGYRAISKHPNANDLLFEVLDDVFQHPNGNLANTLRNPSLNFERLNDLDKFIKNAKSHINSKIKRFTSESHIKWILAANRNLPIEFIRKYYSNCDFKGMKLAIERICASNVNIRQIIKEFPSFKRQASLLQNPAYYTYCVEEETRKYLYHLTC